MYRRLILLLLLQKCIGQTVIRASRLLVWQGVGYSRSLSVALGEKGNIRVFSVWWFVFGV